MDLTFTKQASLRGEIRIPGDKSISHRSVMLGALAEGTTRVTHFLQGADCLSTIAAFRAMGIAIEQQREEILIHGKGLHGLKAPSIVLDLGNSGTTARLLAGILAGQEFTSQMDGDASLRTRPMERIMNPLAQMGTDISSMDHTGCLPLRIRGGGLHAIDYTSPVASAQVKSCLLFAGMYAADGKMTSVTEPVRSRNHSELLMAHFGAKIVTDQTRVSIAPEPELKAREIMVPGDISSAAYFIAAGLLVPDSEILIRDVGINPTRDGILEVCRAMGGDLTLLHQREEGGEPIADILVRSSALHGTTIAGEIIPTLIDELPVIAVMAACAEGETVITDASELRVKETDRIEALCEGLSAMGTQIMPLDDGMVIQGGAPLRGASVDSRRDHRLAMSYAVAALVADGRTTIKDGDCVRISYPHFYEDLEQLSVS